MSRKSKSGAHDRTEEKRRLQWALEDVGYKIGQALFPDDGDMEDAHSEELKVEEKRLKAKIREIEEAQRKAKAHRDRRGKQPKLPRRMPQRTFKQLRAWLRDALENEKIAPVDLIGLRDRCGFDRQRLEDFAYNTDLPTETEHEKEIFRVEKYIQKYCGYISDSEEDILNLMWFLFWMMRQYGVKTQTLCRDININPETFRRWKTGELQPDMNSICSAFKKLNITLVPVPISHKSAFFERAHKTGPQNESFCWEWSYLTHDDIDRIGSYCTAFHSLVITLRSGLQN